MMYGAPQLWDVLMTKLVQTVADYVRLQIDAGVHAVQLFDSWVGCLSVADYRRYVAPYSKSLIDRIGGRVPIIYFGTGNSHLVDDMYAAGPDVLALDWRTPIRDTWDRLGCTAVQGNLDPIVLCADRAAVAAQTQAILDEVGGRNGHIFNLGSRHRAGDAGRQRQVSRRPRARAFGALAMIRAPRWLILIGFWIPFVFTTYAAFAPARRADAVPGQRHHCCTRARSRI